VTPRTIRFRKAELDRPDINNLISITGFSPETELLVCNQSIEVAPFELATGTATINFSVSTGELLSRPEIDGSCRVEDEAGELLYRYTLNGTPSTQMDVLIGSVRIAGIAGSCNLVATADVNGSNTEFGRFTLDIEPGTDVVIDIGAPDLAITTPQPGICVADDSVLVTGTVQDDGDVASVTVNGEAAQLNAIAENSYSFSISVPLVAGLNNLEIQAVDTSGNQITDNRTVNQDSAAPTVTWSPADGQTVFDESIEVFGTVFDESDIASLMLNGESVSLVPTDVNGEYTFSTTITLVEGTNVLTLVARDTSGCEDTVQVRNIQYQLQPPVTGVTRSKGYWSNHPDSIEYVLDQFGSITRCDGVELTSVCDVVSTLKLKGNKNNANAKRQSAAAALNCWAFGCDSQIEPASACSNALGSGLDDFNNSGTNLALPDELSGFSADPKFCR